MSKFTLDQTSYDTDKLSDKGKVILRSLELTEMKLKKLQQEVNIFNTAKQVYIHQLQAEIDQKGIVSAESS
tara:strand:- start:5940 stop:6152 length:213 start_codon:yes stop_codon:yes gene_type:complete